MILSIIILISKFPAVSCKDYLNSLKLPGNIIAKVYSIITIFFALVPRAAIHFLLSIYRRTDIGKSLFLLFNSQRVYSPATFKKRAQGTNSDRTADWCKKL